MSEAAMGADFAGRDEARGRPLLLGRIKRNDSGRCYIVGHTGDVRAIPSAWYDALRYMDGFHSFADIATTTGRPIGEIHEIFDAVRGEKRLGYLEDWNRNYYCADCSLYLSGATRCTVCERVAARLPLLPPCDAWILFETEYAFVARLLKEHANIEIDEDRVLLGNNGVRNNKFFWQILYDGKLILHIDFVESDPGSWRVQVADAAHHVDWARPTHGLEREIERMARANAPSLAVLEADTIAFIEEVTGFYSTMPLLYFSGGKESVVILRLLEKAGLRSNVVFVGTGVDFPEDKAFLLETLKPRIDANPQFHFEVNLASSEDFLGIFRRERQLDARSAWCRKYIKAPLKAEVTDRLYGSEHFVAFEGSRWYENDFRRSHPRVNFAQGYERQIWVHPLAPWGGLDVWLYIYQEGLPINPMYRRGYQRTTCWLCPIVNPFHLETSKQQYPELWRKLEGLKLIGFDAGDNLHTPF